MTYNEDQIVLYIPNRGLHTQIVGLLVVPMTINQL